MIPLPAEKIAANIIEICRSRGLRLVTAESCTGGMVAASITEVAGASEVFERGFITYSNLAKQEMLGVAPETLLLHGAVSAQTVLEMANGGLSHAQCDMAVAITGIAGPGGGTFSKPVGLVYIAVVRKGFDPIVEEHLFEPPQRADIRKQAMIRALILLEQVAWL